MRQDERLQARAKRSGRRDGWSLAFVFFVKGCACTPHRYSRSAPLMRHEPRTRVRFKRCESAL